MTVTDADRKAVLEHNPICGVGGFALVSDPSIWREAAVELARAEVGTGKRVTIAVKGGTIAWRCPVIDGIVPVGWQYEMVMT